MIRQRLLSGKLGDYGLKLLQGGAGSLSVKVANVLLGLIVSATLARLLGPQGYGTYAYTLVLVSVLSVCAQFGLPNLVVRETAIAHSNSNWSVLIGLWRWSTRVAFILGVIFVALAVASLLVFPKLFPDFDQRVLLIGMLIVPLMTLSIIKSAALRGLRNVILGQVPEMIIRPGILLILLIVVSLSIATGEFSAVPAIMLHVVAALFALVGAVLLFRLHLPTEVSQKPPPPRYRIKPWLVSSVPLALIAIMNTINSNTDILMLGFLSSAENVGVYRVTTQVSLLVAFGMQAANVAMAPHFARLYSQGNIDTLQSVVTKSVHIVLMMSVPIVLLLIFFGPALLETIFGSEYAKGANVLIILSCGQLFNASMGPVGILLNMTGHERDALIGLAIAAAVNILLNAILIPRYGILGAGISTTISMVLWNLTLQFFVRYRLGIVSHAFYR